MNPDNPNFRTPEEEHRAREFEILKAANKDQRERIKELEFERDSTEKVYRMNREYVDQAKERIKELEAHITEQTQRETNLRQDWLEAMEKIKELETRIAQMKEMHDFGVQCYQDDCENAYVHATVHKEAKKRIQELQAEIERHKSYVVPGYEQVIGELKAENTRLKEALENFAGMSDLDCGIFGTYDLEPLRKLARAALEAKT